MGPTEPGGEPVPRGAGALRPPTPPGSRRRRTRLLLTGGAVLVVGAAVAGASTFRTSTAGPDSPQGVAEAFMSAGLRYDWRASWKLLCRSEQLDRGSFDRYVLVKETAAAVIGRPDNGGMSVTVGELRPYTHVASEAWLVEVQLARDDETHDMQLVVVAEENGFRACGQR